MTTFPAESAYLDELAARLRRLLGEDLVGVYVGGSYALGDYEPGRSDLDVAAVVAGPLAERRRAELVAALRHESLACPARGLELVVYTAKAAGAPTAEAAFELNLNTGARMPFRVDTEPVPGELHWFAPDRAVLQDQGIALLGPPADVVFAALTPSLLLPVLAEVLRWYRSDGRRDDAVLNACRSLRFAQESSWSSKPAAARWALAGPGVEDRALVAEALAARRTGAELDAGRVDAFLARAVARLEAGA